MSVLLRRAPKMPLEPLHQCGIDTLEIRASKPVPRAFNAHERRGHARLRQRPVHRLALDDRDDPVGVTVHDERGSSPVRAADRPAPPPAAGGLSPRTSGLPRNTLISASFHSVALGETRDLSPTISDRDALAL